MRIVIFFFSFLFATAAFLPQAYAECITGDCHPGFRKKAFPHAPVEDNCISCHVRVAAEHPLAGQKSFQLDAGIPELCFQCHEKFGSKKFVHAPVKEGDCLSCHQVHGASNRFLLDIGQNQSDLCFGCHATDSFTLPSIHGPAAAGACTNCHSPHASAHKALLVAPVRQICLGCHLDFASEMQAAGVIHPPAQKDPCTNCHAPHSSAAAFILKKKMPDLCFDCHAAVAIRVANAKHKHKPIGEAASCGGCHSTHFSNVRGLLPTAQKNLCLGCHGSDKLGNPPLKNIKKELEAKKYLHGPIKQERCVPCHEPHGSDHPRLLTGRYPDTVYFPYQSGAYDFCLQCHEKNLLRFKETTLYTNFRNGNLNLHYVHVSDKRKGRTCRTCHAPHASDGARLISKEGAPFGSWKIPIRFEATSTGGSCAPGCHRPMKFDRQAPVDYGKEKKSF